LPGDISDDESLRRTIVHLLERVANDQDKNLLSKASSARDAPSDSGEDVEGPGVPDNAANSRDDQVGILDLFERVNQLGAQFEAEMLEWTQSVAALGESAVSATAQLEELAQFGNPAPAEVRKVIDRVTVDFTDNAAFVETRSPTLTSQLAEFTALIDAQIRLMPDFEIPPTLAAKRFAETKELSESLHLAYYNAKGLIDSVAELPRMSTDFNVARHRLVRAYEPFLKQLEASTKAIDEIVHAMRRALPDDSGPTVSDNPKPSRPLQKKRRRPRKRR
jgi:hypothetical protein